LSEESGIGRIPLEVTVPHIDEQDERVIAILGTINLDVSKANLKTYLKYIKHQIEFPCLLTGIEDFDWEEFYVFGPGSQKEYKELKKTRPSYTDKYNLISIVDKIENEEDGIVVEVERVSDKKRFKLPLAELEETNKKTRNYQLLDDYAVWFVNYQ
jgi:hypothetical protein